MNTKVLWTVWRLGASQPTASGLGRNEAHQLAAKLNRNNTGPRFIVWRSGERPPTLLG